MFATKRRVHYTTPPDPYTGWMSRPLIGVTGRRWPASFLGDHLPPAMHGLTVDLHFSDYTRSIALAGGVPVELSRDADVDEVAARLDGLVLSGGADIEPSRYGAAPEPGLGDVEPDRDAWELALFEAAQRRGIPVLAICRGLQLVNVARGGTLVQDVPSTEGVGHPRFESDGRRRTHDVSVVEGTRLAELYPSALAVNSLHHQVVDRVGEGLVVSAKAPDGVVEGLESADGDVLAVQWHPELLDAPDSAFRWVVSEAQRRLR